jgi:hypothetical protein
VMRDTTYGPIFLRLGDRRRAPKGTPMAVLRRVSVSDIDCYALDKRYCSVVAGLPNGQIEDVSFSNIRQLHAGGGSAADAARKPPENEGNYPEPDMFGVMPAYGFYLRHVKGVTMQNVEMSTLKPDARPAVITDDVTNLRSSGVIASSAPGTPLTPVSFGDEKAARK